MYTAFLRLHPKEQWPFLTCPTPFTCTTSKCRGFKRTTTRNPECVSSLGKSGRPLKTMIDPPQTSTIDHSSNPVQNTCRPPQPPCRTAGAPFQNLARDLPEIRDVFLDEPASKRGTKEGKASRRRRRRCVCHHAESLASGRSHAAIGDARQASSVKIDASMLARRASGIDRICDRA